MGIFSFLNPFMPWLGVAAIASPVIIHLLNKRRYKIINWAAMDFLFEADKKNRRRVKLENFILLMLRCLAMLLIGLFLSRLFLPTSLTKAFSNTQKFEHIILLDDSMSQRVRVGNEELINKSKAALKQLVDQAATNNRDDWITVMLTSQIQGGDNKRYIDNEPIVEEKLSSLLKRIDNIEATDSSANYDAALTELETTLRSSNENVNRVVYLITDMRERDWVREQQSENSPSEIVKRLSDSEDVASTFVVDVGSEVEENITITGVKAADQLVADTVVRFDVSVLNQGRKLANNVGVRFQVNDEPSRFEEIPTLKPGVEETVTFYYSFNYPVDEAGEDLEEKIARNLKNFSVRAEIVREGKIVDSLAEDSSGYFAARVMSGIPVLLVDGAPSQDPFKSETHFLRSLEVHGAGLLVDTITISELETVSLSKYKVIFLCNVDQATKERLQSLKDWVTNGGGLVIMPGDQIRATDYNDSFYKSGLSPFKLVGSPRGDETRQKWVHFAVEQQVHPALVEIRNADDTILEAIEIFSWWGTEMPPDRAKNVDVAMRLTDADNSLAMVDQPMGKGRVVAFTIPADVDWSWFPADATTYTVVMLELVKHLVGNVSGNSDIEIGGKLTHLVDLSNYERTVTLLDPNNEKREAVTKTGDEKEDVKIMRPVEFDDISQRGIYKLMLQRKDSKDPQAIYFATNVDPTEGNLKRLDLNKVGQNYFGEKTRLVTNEELAAQSVSSGNSEIWYFILIALAAILGLEQFLGWWFGRRR